MDDFAVQPNGIALSPDATTVYISDTGAVMAPITQSAESQKGATFNPLGRRTIYAFNISCDDTYLFNRRPIYFAQDWVPDGLKVAANGYVLTGAGRGVDVLSPQGDLIVRVQANYTVQNFAWVGDDLNEFWMMGQGGVSRVRWNLTGQDLSSPST